MLSEVYTQGLYRHSIRKIIYKLFSPKQKLRNIFFCENSWRWARITPKRHNALKSSSTFSTFRIWRSSSFKSTGTSDNSLIHSNFWFLIIYPVWFEIKSPYFEHRITKQKKVSTSLRYSKQCSHTSQFVWLNCSLYVLSPLCLESIHS